jgi:hypothetical protein
MPKMKIFDLRNRMKGRIVLLDLDIMITGNLDELFRYDGPFMTREAFRHSNLSGGDLVFFSAPHKYPFWEYIRMGHPAVGESKGNERLMYRHFFASHKERTIDYVQQLYPNQIFSYRHHAKKEGRVPDNCRILSCHGTPRPHELTQIKWLKEYWNG